MSITVDPEGNETRTLHDLAEFDAKDVVEIGCGDGRMTWRYAELAHSVLALDPNEDRIREAREQIPETLGSIVSFRDGTVQSVALPEHGFDVAILSWSL